MSADLHHSTLTLADRFVTDHGRDPSLEADDPDERRLAMWQARALANMSQGGQSRWHRVFEQAQALIRFQHEHHRMPSNSAEDAVEAALARWAKAHLNQSYPHPLVLQLAAKHDWSSKPAERRVDELRSFVEAHGRLPGPTCRTQSERALWRWVLARIERGKLPAEAQQIVDTAGGYSSHLMRRKALVSSRAR